MTTANITCLCGSINVPLTDPLPAATELCHCNPCRQTTGALFAGFAGPLDTVPDSSILDKCTVYHSSKTHDRYFCSTCATKLFVHPHHWNDGSVRDTWHCYGGAIDPPASIDASSASQVGNVLRVETNEWLADTGGDGGMAPFLSKLGGRDIPCYETDTSSKLYSQAELGEMIKTSQSLPVPGKGSTLKAECRCGGVSLRIQRADHTDRTVSQLDRFIPKDHAGEPENDRHMAFACVCRFCRLHTGVSFSPWLYVPPVQVINPHTNEPVSQHRAASTDTEANRGLTLKHYWSSPEACRSFCAVCGAAVFYSHDRRQEIVNVAAGLLRPGNGGILARQWLSWQWGRTAWKDEATDRDIMEAWKATGAA